MSVKEPHGVARLTHGGKLLVVTTQAKRGKKLVPNVVAYAVTDAKPDPSVAFPVYALTKEDGTVWHVSVNEWGASCDCPHATFRGGNSRVQCKHIAAAMATGLLPKPIVHEGGE